MKVVVVIVLVERGGGYVGVLHVGSKEVVWSANVRVRGGGGHALGEDSSAELAVLLLTPDPVL